LTQRKLKDRELAADLINEAIVVTLDHIRIGRPIEPRHVAGYVFKVGLNLLRNRQRNAHNRADLRADAKTLETLSECDDDVVQATQIRQKALQVINSLGSPRDREVVKRFYLDEDEKVVICADLGLTPLQFTQVMSRARQRMKLLFESQGIKSTDFYSFIVVLGVALLHSSLFA
jgi:RNA polymerase sigma-70 factor (ECF subfamily)